MATRPTSGTPPSASAESDLIKEVLTAPPPPIDPKSGLIDWDRAEMEHRELGLPAIFYEPGSGNYWLADASGQWIQVGSSSINRHLRMAGYSSDLLGSKEYSALDAILCRLQLEHHIAYAGPLAGYAAGPREVCGQRILVTRARRLIESGVKKRFPTIERLLDQQLGAQLDHFLGWLKWAIQCLEAQNFAPGQLLVLAGPPGSGKSLLQQLITEMLGGRVAKPYRYMVGLTQFNSDLFGSEHLAIEDEAPSTDLRARRVFGTNLKNLLVNATHSCHAKGRPAISLSCFWRLTLSVNEEPEQLMVLPPLDESLRDKMMMLQVSQPKILQRIDSPKHRERFWYLLCKELRPFMQFIHRWKIPRDLQDPRYGVATWQHPGLVDALQSLSPERKLLSLIDTWKLLENGAAWEGSADELEQWLRANDKFSQIDRLLSFQNACGTFLGRLTTPRVTKRVLRGRTIWRITPPE